MRENYAANVVGSVQSQRQGAAMGYAAMSQNQACEARQSAKSRMRQKAETLRREAARLDALADALPEVLTEPADSALWELLSRS